MTLLPVTDGEFQGSPSSYGQRSVINGISVYDLYNYGHGPYVRTHYLLPSLGVEIEAEGPLAKRVIDTLSRSPRTVALASGPAPVVPSSWHTVTDAGLRFAVPARWHTFLPVGAGACRSEGPTLLNRDSVVLTTDLSLCREPALAPTVRPPGNGVQVDVDASPSFAPATLLSKHCLSLGALIACPATSPAYSILVLKVTVPRRSEPVYVSIGLAGNGSVARTILYSLRPATAQGSASSVTTAYLIPVGASDLWAAWYSGGGFPGSSQGVQLSTNAGRTWRVATPPRLATVTADNSVSNLFALNATHAWVTYGPPGSEKPRTFVATADGGRVWHVVGRLPDPNCQLQFVTPSDGWCPAIGNMMGQSYATIYRTTDGGRRWHIVSFNTPQTHSQGALPSNCDKDIGFVNSEEGWAFSSCNSGLAPLYETTDAGRTWVAAEIAPPAFAFDYSDVNEMPVLVGKDGAIGYDFSTPSAWRTVVYVTSDGGASWHAVVPPGPARHWTADLITPSLWRLVSGDEILATDDAGHTWRTVHSNTSFNGKLVTGYNLSTAPVRYVTGEVGWICTWSGTTGAYSLWRTTDGGSVWRQISIPAV